MGNIATYIIHSQNSHLNLWSLWINYTNLIDFILSFHAFSFNSSCLWRTPANLDCLWFPYPRCVSCWHCSNVNPPPEANSMSLQMPCNQQHIAALFFTGGYPSVTCSFALKTSSCKAGILHMVLSAIAKSAFHPQKQNGCKETYLLDTNERTRRNDCAAMLYPVDLQHLLWWHLYHSKKDQKSMHLCRALRAVNTWNLGTSGKSRVIPNPAAAHPWLTFSNTWMLSVPLELRLRICQRISCAL